jgi:hypothetical protein
MFVFTSYVEYLKYISNQLSIGFLFHLATEGLVCTFRSES